MNITQEKQIAIKAAKKAGKMLLKKFITHNRANVRLKSKHEIVTPADLASEKIILSAIKKNFPDHRILSEEKGKTGNQKSDYLWLIDPLDGTKGFIHQDGQFCINVALMEGHKPILGFIHIPLTNETFYGYKNKAWKHISGKTIPIQTRNRPLEGSVLLLSNYDLKNKDKWEPYLKGTRLAKIEPLHSAIKFCRVAEGAADIYFRFVPCKEWDTAAGQILVEAAGGLMATLDGLPFLYGKPDLKNEGFQVLGHKL